jgi:hypothetical protein
MSEREDFSQPCASCSKQIAAGEEFVRGGSYGYAFHPACLPGNDGDTTTTTSTSTSTSTSRPTSTSRSTPTPTPKRQAGEGNKAEQESALGHKRVSTTEKWYVHQLEAEDELEAERMRQDEVNRTVNRDPSPSLPTVPDALPEAA